MGKLAKKLVIVEWEDSARPISAWTYLEDFNSPEVIKCCSVGWVVSDRGGVIALAPNLGDVDSGGSAQACGIIQIPKRCVVKVLELQENAKSARKKAR